MVKKLSIEEYTDIGTELKQGVLKMSGCEKS